MSCNYYNMRREEKIMRLPNGFGNVSKLPGNRRNPYRARVTTGWVINKEGRKCQQYKTIGYFASREEGLFALFQYHQQPIAEVATPTFSDVYKLWKKEHFPKISVSNQRGYTSGYHQCESLYHLPFHKIRLAQLQQVIDSSDKNYPVLRRIKILFSQLYKYAMQNDICEKDYSQYVDVIQYKEKNPNSYPRTPFSAGEIAKLWELAPHNDTAKIVLMLIYSGCRIGELLELKKKHVNLKERYFYIEHAKTISGIRYVPIASKVMPLWQWWYEHSSSEHLFQDSNGKPLTYHHFYYCFWQPFMEKNHFSHLPHDTRHTCISLLTMARIDDKCIRKIVGHKGQNVTEIVYTHFEIKKLQEAIDQI